VRDPNGAPGKTSDPGTVALLVSTPPARYASVNATIQQTRAAGVLATVIARYVFVTPRIVLTLAAPITPAGKLKLVGQLIDGLQGYVDSLAAGDPADGAAMLAAAVKAHPELAAAKPRYADVIVSQSDVQHAGLQPLVDRLVGAVRAAPSDAAAVAQAIGNVLSGDVPPNFTESRVPARGLVMGASGRASDDEIAAGKFTVVPPPPEDGEKWSIALDMQLADVQIVG
jgi:hypothetical protein